MNSMQLPSVAGVYQSSRMPVAIWLLALVVLAPASLAIALATGWLTLPAALPSAGHLLVMLVAAPLIEELVFRGHLQPLLTRWFAGKAVAGLKAHAVAIVVCSLIFAALHWLENPDPAVGWVVLPSLALGALQVKTGKWQICAVMHSFFNLVWCLAIGLQAR